MGLQTEVEWIHGKMGDTLLKRINKAIRNYEETGWIFSEIGYIKQDEFMEHCYNVFLIFKKEN